MGYIFGRSARVGLCDLEASQQKREMGLGEGCRPAVAGIEHVEKALRMDVLDIIWVGLGEHTVCLTALGGEFQRQWNQEWWLARIDWVVCWLVGWVGGWVVGLLVG